MTITLLAASGWPLVALVLGALWLWQRSSRDAGIADVGWAFSVGLLVLWYAVASPGLAERRLLVATMTCLWSLRLALYILRDRVLSGDEDGRYQQLRASWGAKFQTRMFLFFQGQALLAVLFSLPPLVAMRSQRPDLGALDLAGILVWAAAITGESLADRQLARFRSDPANRGRTCRIGLWRYSRHPNYFFEWLHWWAYTLVAWGSDHFWLTVAAPFVMLVFVLFITGIPPTEARALESRGEDYRRYQRSTSAFFPWFPKPELEAQSPSPGPAEKP
jgi:steroid 5-alpha reductase family enzyme